MGFSEQTIQKHWKILPLKEIVTVLGDGLHGTPKYSEVGEYHFINGNNLGGGRISVKDSTKRVSVEEYNKYKKPLNDRTVLISINGTLGNVAFYENEKVILGKSACYFNLKDTIDKKYVFYVLSSQQFLNYAHNTATGSTIPNVSLKAMREFRLPIPPMEEQVKIVSKIEELFSEIENIEKQFLLAKKQMNIFRQSILKTAFQNKPITRISNLFDFIGGGTPSKQNSEYWNGSIPWASVKDIKGNYLNQTLDSITEKGLANSAANIADPNEVIIITRISPGKPIISNIKAAINQDLKIVKPKFVTTPKFIYYVFKLIERECIKRSSGTTVLGITLPNLKEINVPNIDISEQHEIVSQIEEGFSVCDKIEETIDVNLNEVEILKQSILKKAFEGKLI